MRKLAWSQRPSRAEQRRKDKGNLRRKQQRRLKREMKELHQATGATHLGAGVSSMIRTYHAARQYLTVWQSIGYLLDCDRRHGSPISPLDWLEWKTGKVP